MYLEKEIFENRPEFLKSQSYQNISTTVSSEDVKADEKGEKFVFAGTIIDSEGKEVEISTAGVFSSKPAGILFATVEVTHGDQAGALMIDGSVNTERLKNENAVTAAKALAKKMPFIKFFVDDKLVISE